MRVKFNSNQGTDRLVITAYPSNIGVKGAPEVEINRDGYIAWIVPSIVGNYSYEYVLNNQILDLPKNLEPDTLLVLMFGETALKCHSLVDKNVQDFPHAPGNPNKTLTNEILPHRPRIKKFKTLNYYIADIYFTIEIKEHEDLPLYYPYYPDSPLAAQGFDFQASLSENVPEFASSAKQFWNYTRKIRYLIADLALIKDQGINRFRVNAIPPGGRFLPENSASGFGFYSPIWAEFYARNISRKVKQSWTKDSIFGVLVNDTPLYFAVEPGDGTAVPAIGLDFDLSGIDNTKSKPKPLDRTTPTKQYAFYGYDFVAQKSSAIDTTPYTNGYWRPGDAWSLQGVPPNTPWETVIRGVVPAYFVKDGVAAANGSLTDIAQGYIDAIKAFYAGAISEGPNGTLASNQNLLDPKLYPPTIKLQAIVDAGETLTQTAVNAYNTSDIYQDAGSLDFVNSVIEYVQSIYDIVDINSQVFSDMVRYSHATSNLDNLHLQIFGSSPIDGLNVSLDEIQVVVDALQQYRALLQL